MSIKVFIDGAEGTTGLQLKQRLLSHSKVKLLTIPDNMRKNKNYKLEMFSQAEVVFLCLPDNISIETVKLIDKNKNLDVILIDASSSHRVNPSWIYGFPELDKEQRQKIINSKRISNPGCYATGAVSLIRPLVDNDILNDNTPLVIHAISGFTGGGKNLISYFSKPERETFVHYGLPLQHKHLKEINKYGLIKKTPIFCPSVGAFPQGMTVSVPIHFEWCREGITGAKIRDSLYKWYNGNKFISVKPLNNFEEMTKQGFLTPEVLIGTNNLEISIYSNDKLGQAWILARLDNLGKGASAAAVQNMNLVLGFKEDTGLDYS